MGSAKASDHAALRELSLLLGEFATANPLARLTASADYVELKFMDAPGHPWVLYAWPGAFDLVYGPLTLEHQPLRSPADVSRALAICDTVVQGKGVWMASPDLRIYRSWLFVDSRGVRETVRSGGVSAWSCRRARSIPKSQWQRVHLPPLSQAG